MVYFHSKPEEWMILFQPLTSPQLAVRTLFIHSKEPMLMVSTAIFFFKNISRPAANLTVSRRSFACPG